MTTVKCGCGCGVWFMPIRKDQKYLPGHRFAAYSTHECPACNASHRVKVTRG